MLAVFIVLNKTTPRVISIFVFVWFFEHNINEKIQYGLKRQLCLIFCSVWVAQKGVLVLSLAGITGAIIRLSYIDDRVSVDFHKFHSTGTRSVCLFVGPLRKISMNEFDNKKGFQETAFESVVCTVPAILITPRYVSHFAPSNMPYPWFASRFQPYASKHWFLFK